MNLLANPILKGNRKHICKPQIAQGDIYVIYLYGVSQVVLVAKNTAASSGDVREMDLINGLWSSLGVGHGNPLQNCLNCLENPMDKGA